MLSARSEKAEEKCGKEILSSKREGFEVKIYEHSDNKRYVKNITLMSKKGTVRSVMLSYEFKKNIFEDDGSDSYSEKTYNNLIESTEKVHSWEVEKEISKGAKEGRLFGKEFSGEGKYSGGTEMLSRVSKNPVVYTGGKENEPDTARAARIRVRAEIAIGDKMFKVK
jgi:hypothetical protein